MALRAVEWLFVGFLRGGQMSFGFGLNSFSSSVGVSSVVHVFMLFLQDYACGGVFVPCFLQHKCVALLLALVAQALDGMGGGWLKVQVARDVAQRVAVVGFDNGLRFGLCFGFGCLGGAECAQDKAEN